MNVSNRKAKFVGLITVIIIGLIILFVISRIFSYVNRLKEIVQNTDVKEDSFNLNINGDYLTYVRVNEKYNEEGAIAYFDKQNISDDIIVSYYKDNSQVSSVDTSIVGTFTVKYEITNNGEYKDKTRVVVVTDDIAPNLSVPDTVTITSDEAASYDVESGVVVSDNTGEASFSCDNTLSSVPDDYIVTCIARDKNGNETVRKRLIKVVSGIEFEYDELIYRTDADVFVGTIGEEDPQILDKEFNQKLTGIISKVDSQRGYIKIRTNGEYKYYNFKFEEKQNTEIFPDNTLFLSKKDGKYGYINKQGEVVVDYIYDDATEQNEYGYVSVNKGGKWGSLDKDGKVVAEPIYTMQNNTVIEFIGKWHLAEDLNANYYTDAN